jgi:hypothetical protein
LAYSLFFNKRWKKVYYFIYALGDYGLVCPTVLFGGLFAKNALPTAKVYQYRLTYPNSQSFCNTSVWANVTHGDQLPLVFGQAFRPLEELNARNEEKP